MTARPISSLPAGAPKPVPFFQGIHALRGLAAILVVCSHARYVSHDFIGLPDAPGRIEPVLGRIGVILFFAISGFVIALNRARPIAEFALHRVLRIYPSYWLAMAAAAVAFVLVGRPVTTTAAMIFLLPATVSSDALVIPYWTLIFEILFYALAIVAFAARLTDRNLTVLALLWIVAVNVFGTDPATGVQYTFPGSAILLSAPVQVFPIGLVCGINHEKLRGLGRIVYLIAAGFFLAVSCVFANLSIARTLMLGLASAGAVMAVADLDLRSQLATMLGNASYGIYLMHFPAMVFLALLLPALTWLGGAYFFAAGLLAGIAFGLVDHRLYRWMISKARRA